MILIRQHRFSRPRRAECQLRRERDTEDQDKQGVVATEFRTGMPFKISSLDLQADAP